MDSNPTEDWWERTQFLKLKWKTCQNAKCPSIRTDRKYAGEDARDIRAKLFSALLDDLLPGLPESDHAQQTTIRGNSQPVTVGLS